MIINSLLKMFFPIGVLVIFVLLSPSRGQEYTMIPIGAKKCPLQIGSGLETIKYDFDITDDGLEASAELLESITKDYTYRADINIMTSGQYIHFIEPNGNFCNDINEVGKIAWDNFRATVEPPLEHPCTIETGKYKVKSFKIKKDDIDVPISTDGQFMSQLHLHNEKGVEVACLEMEFKIFED